MRIVSILIWIRGLAVSDLFVMMIIIVVGFFFGYTTIRRFIPDTTGSNGNGLFVIR